MRALAAGCVPVVARLPVYEELVGDGERGLLFEPGDAQTLAAQLARLVADPALRERLRDAADPLRERLRWARVADELEEVYAGLVARRHDDRGDPALARTRRASGRGSTSTCTCTPTTRTTARRRSRCCWRRRRRAGPRRDRRHRPQRDLRRARGAGEGRAAIKVIVGEEVKTADQGEVIGLFLSEKIPRGLTLEETVAEIKRQGGVVYVPHPFDRMHAVPDYEHLLTVLDDVDAIEVYNPRVAIGSFNEEAARFAAKYRIPAGAGSDAHVAAGARLGAHPHARLRRAGGVPGVAARGRHRAHAGIAALRAGAEVPADEGHAAERARAASRERRVRRAARKA